MQDHDFVHLHLHTDYSLLDGAIQIKPLSERLENLGMKACAMTDHGNMYGAISFYNTMKARGIKPIIGCETYIAPGSRKDRAGRAAPGEKANFHLILLAQDRFDDAAAASLEFEEILGKGNYFLEIQDHGLEAQARIRKPLVELSKRTGIPLVATNDAHYLMPDDARAHDVLLCIGSGKTVGDQNRLRYGTPNFYVRSPNEMWDIFGAELPEALQRTVEIAETCDLTLPKGINYLPNYPIPESDPRLSADEYFEKTVRDGYQTRKVQVWDLELAKGELKHTFEEYEARLSHE